MKTNKRITGTILTGIAACSIVAAAPSPVAHATTGSNDDNMTVKVYQAENSSTGSSIMSTNYSTIQSKSSAGFSSQNGSPFFASTQPVSGLTDIRQLYKASLNDYMYVPVTNQEYGIAKSYGYVDQGTAFYASTWQQNNTSPVYRLTKGNHHRYTTSASQVNSLKSAGWTSDGARFWADTKPAAAFDAAYHDNVNYAYTNATNTSNSYSTRQDAWQVAREAHTTWAMGTNESDANAQRVINNAKSAGQVAQLTLYAIPGRDCGSYSSGGMSSDSAYRAWIDKWSSAIGNQKAMIVVEPDAIGFCNNTKRTEYSSLLNYVGSKFASNNPNAELYLHAGSGEFQYADMLSRFKSVGLQNYRGFAMDVASLRGTSREESWAEGMVTYAAANGMPGLHYVTDTSRAGIDSPANASNATYPACNNFNAAMGPRPSANTAGEHEDAYLWVKSIGLSDGQCGKGDPASGTWYPSYLHAVVANGVRVGSVKMVALNQ